jgi:hypothetical protein
LSHKPLTDMMTRRDFFGLAALAAGSFAMKGRVVIPNKLEVISKEQGEAILYDVFTRFFGSVEGVGSDHSQPRYQFTANEKEYEVAAYANAATSKIPLRPNVFHVIGDYHALMGGEPLDRADEKSNLFGYNYHNAPEMDNEELLRQAIVAWIAPLTPVKLNSWGSIKALYR